MKRRAASPRVQKQRDASRPASAFLFLIGVGIFLALGFVFGAWQHLTATDFGYRNEQLIEHKKKLEMENRRLLLERERVRAPQRIDDAARMKGFVVPALEQASKEAATTSVLSDGESFGGANAREKADPSRE